ncbi:hypothetical protein [Solicola gregarius]|uniref:Lipoprotein n=1 Tax=Solicola gregarius TaxID=2908642 RepID=A0AA46TEJ0_9ACTN|nr:hypothetical protein [Solicola gregarius]UYM03738.1 hypothetical protein L0C25_14440 [Solicola gregarius]
MRRVVTGIATCALLTVATACTSGSDTDASDTPTKHVAVEPDEVVRHEAASGTPISFGIEVPDGAVQVGPLIRQRRVDVESVIDAADGRANAFTDEHDDETNPETRDPEEPTPPDFTTAMLRVDDDPSEVVHATISELADALEGSEIDADHWRDYCAVDNGVYVGCRLAARGTTDDDEHVAVELTVYPGDHGSRLAAAGSLLRPVMVLTLEQVAKPADHGDGEPPRLTGA